MSLILIKFHITVILDMKIDFIDVVIRVEDS